MPTKEEVVQAVQDAFREGAGSASLAPGVENDMRDYWERCYEVNREDIEKKWDNGGRAEAVKKVEAMGVHSAAAAAAKTGEQKIVLTDFHKARREVNKPGDEQTGWCLLEK